MATGTGCPAGRRPRGPVYALLVASALCDPVRFAGRYESHQHGWILSLTPEHVAVCDGRASNVYNSPYSRFSILVIYFQYWVSQEWAQTQW